MSTPISDYALLSNLHSAALVSRAGSIDWFCPGRFDAPACFAALLGRREHGRWAVAPVAEPASVERSYRHDTLVLETCFTTDQGRVRVIDAMPLEVGCHIVRLVEGLEGRVAMSMVCNPRLHYGSEAPDSAALEGDGSVRFEWENDRLALMTDAGQLQVQESAASLEFEVKAGETCCFTLSHATADHRLPRLGDAYSAVEGCARWWREWIGRCEYKGRWQGTVRRSLITLKAMTYGPTGAMVAAITTSLPEIPGGSANYDYRFCWLRDAAFALNVLLNAGYRQEACAWRDWLLKAVRQHDMPLHTLYAVDAGVVPEERDLHWLPGHSGSRPVREGNRARRQYQLDLRGELMQVFHLARNHGLDLSDDVWDLQCRVLDYLEDRWQHPDRGIWEFRQIHDHLTHSKIMCWVAYDRCIRDAEDFGLEGPLAHWRSIRERIREDVLECGVHPTGGYFTQRYGSDEVDASLLMIPLVGFVPADDPRMKATVEAIERDLCEGGLVRRYRTGDSANEEGVFLPCAFWLASNYWLSGRRDDAEALYRRLLGLCNDVGLMSEEYDVVNQRPLGNFPQGLSHLGLVSTARLIATASDADTALT